MKNQILINAVSIRTGGSETFLRNILPLIAGSMKQISFLILISKTRRNLYSTNFNNVKFVEIDDKKIANPLKRVLFEHVLVPLFHLKYKTKIHWQMDEVLSPLLAILGIKSIVVFHSTPMVFFKNLTNDGFLIDSYMKLMRGITSRFATIPVCVSFHARAELSGLYPAMRNRLQVIYHGVNHELYSPGKPDSHVIKKYGILNEYILSISNRFIWKNYYRLVKAFSEMKKRPGMETTDLLLIGEKKNDFEEQRILEFIKCNNLEKSIKIIPFIDQKELHNFYKGAKAYVFSSMEETFGLTILEAMSTEIPCVCACWGVIPEIAGTAAAYFDPLDINSMCDVIYDVCNNQELREKLKLFGKTQCYNFSWNKCAESYRKLLLELTKMEKYSGMSYE